MRPVGHQEPYLVDVFLRFTLYTIDYYSTIKKNEILTFEASWMDLEGIMLSEISPSQKDKYHKISFICGI